MDQSALPDADPVEYHIWQLFNQRRSRFRWRLTAQCWNQKQSQIFLQDYNSGQAQIL